MNWIGAPILFVALSFSLYSSGTNDSDGVGVPTTSQEMGTVNTKVTPLPVSLKPVHVSAEDRDPYLSLAERLAKSSGVDGRINVSMGNFLDGDSDSLSPHSAEVKEELTMALAKTGKFEVITRERLADLQNEGKFQASTMVQSGSGPANVQVKAVDGIIRGRVYIKPSGMVVYASIAYLNGGEVRGVKAVIPDPQSPSPRNDETGGGKILKIEATKTEINPLMDQLNLRLEELSKQVQTDIEDGFLSKSSATELRDEINKVRVKADKYVLQNDGFLSEQEYKQLNRQLDHIHKLSNDVRRATAIEHERTETPVAVQTPAPITVYPQNVTASPVYGQYTPPAPVYYQSAPPLYLPYLANLFGHKWGSYQAPVQHGYQTPVQHRGGSYHVPVQYWGGTSYYKH
jgi:hypothetical protein